MCRFHFFADTDCSLSLFADSQFCADTDADSSFLNEFPISIYEGVQ